MKHRLEEFGERELELFFIATRLNQALDLEKLLDEQGIEYGLEVDTFRGGFLGLSQRTGIFFYALVEEAEACRSLLERQGYKKIVPAPIVAE